MFDLRPFQHQLKTDLYESRRAGNRNILLVSPTGSGKTVVMSSIAADENVPSCAIAHRKELVGQISVALAKMGVTHNIVGADATVSFCINQHITKFGKSFFNRSSSFSVASVDTILARYDSLRQWGSTIKRWMIDEAHHVLPDNKWGKAINLFPNAWGIGYTASPIRCDRKSLGSDQNGIFDDMCVGPSMRQLIDEGYLSSYRIFGPPESIDVNRLHISKATGEFVQKELREASKKSTIVGDVVEHYKRIAPGKRGITFTVDVAGALDIANEFREAGVPAEAISAKTPDGVREALIQKFIDGAILQLVNVDLFGEGFDVPAVEVVSMARPTQSFGLYLQQFGRALRTADGKEFGTIIDHVGNVKRHGLPDAVRSWSLHVERNTRRALRDPDVMPVTTCLECFRAYERVSPRCPFCGYQPVPEDRSRPEFVDGDLAEYSPELIAAMRGEIDRIDGNPLFPQNADTRMIAGIKANWSKRQDAQGQLRNAIAQWAGVRKHVHGEDDRMIHRRFYHRFGVDVMSAMVLGRTEALELETRIKETMI